jgi:hypothetical protein
MTRCDGACPWMPARDRHVQARDDALLRELRVRLGAALSPQQAHEGSGQGRRGQGCRDSSERQHPLGGQRRGRGTQTTHAGTRGGTSQRRRWRGRRSALGRTPWANGQRMRRCLGGGPAAIDGVRAAGIHDGVYKARLCRRPLRGRRRPVIGQRLPAR